MVGLHEPRPRRLGESTVLRSDALRPSPAGAWCAAACWLGSAVGLIAVGLHSPRPRRPMCAESKPESLTMAGAALASASGVTCSARPGEHAPDDRRERGAFGRLLSCEVSHPLGGLGSWRRGESERISHDRASWRATSPPEAAGVGFLSTAGSRAQGCCGASAAGEADLPMRLRGAESVRRSVRRGPSLSPWSKRAAWPITEWWRLFAQPPAGGSKWLALGTAAQGDATSLAADAAVCCRYRGLLLPLGLPQPLGLLAPRGLGQRMGGTDAGGAESVTPRWKAGLRLARARSAIFS